MKTKRFFLAGANTSKGFVSKFDEILSKNKKGYTFVIKGGPGTGKSTLMKKIANHFSQKGFNVEEYYCSSDIDSLDAVRIVEKNICITDGTAPHEQDANLPKVFGEIVDLGVSVNEKIKDKQGKIKKILEKKKNCFKNAYAYLSMAGILASNFSKNENIDLSNVKAKRVLYFDYFNVKGMRSVQQKNKFKTFVLNKNNKLLFNNLFQESRSLVIIKSTLTGNIKAIVFENEGICFKVEKLVLNKENKKILKKLCCMAGCEIAMAREHHKKVEKIFSNYIDFEKLNKITTNLIEKIEKIN